MMAEKIEERIEGKTRRMDLEFLKLDILPYASD